MFVDITNTRGIEWVKPELKQHDIILHLSLLNQHVLLK